MLKLLRSFTCGNFVYHCYIFSRLNTELRTDGNVVKGVDLCSCWMCQRRHIDTNIFCPLQNICCACVEAREGPKNASVNIKKYRSPSVWEYISTLFCWTKCFKWREKQRKILLHRFLWIGMTDGSGNSDPFPPSVPQNSMNLPPDKARLLRQYDNEKKWELICDQVSIARLLPASSARSGTAVRARCPASCSRSAPPSLSSEEVMATDRHHHPQAAFMVTDSKEAVSGLQSEILFRFEVFLCQHWCLGCRWKCSNNTATWYWKWKNVRTSFYQHLISFQKKKVKSSYFSK